MYYARIKNDVFYLSVNLDAIHSESFSDGNDTSFSNLK